MSFSGRRVVLVCCVFVGIFSVFSCQSKPQVEGRVEVTDQRFEIVKDDSYAYVVSASGRIRNVGEYDVKQVIVEGKCESCGTAFIKGTWYGPGIEEEKTQRQTDTINELRAGEEKEFSIEEVVYYYSTKPEPPDHIPGDLKVVVNSFETVPE